MLKSTAKLFTNNQVTLPSTSTSLLTKILLILAITTGLYIASSLIIPLIFALLIAMLLLPIVRFFANKGLNNILSVSIACIVLLLLFSVIAGIFTWQGILISEEFSMMKLQLQKLEQSVFLYVENQFGISKKVQEENLTTLYTKIKDTSIQSISSSVAVLSKSTLTFVYIFLFLLERKRLKNFVLKIFKNKNTTLGAISEIIQTVKDYLYGQLIVTVLLAVVYAIGFFAIGLKFSLMLAILAAILTFIPYLGNIIGAVAVILVGIISGLEFQNLLILIIFLTIVQLIESYIIKPLIIGNEISLNIFAVIFSIVAFSLLWGVSGAILALPLTSIIRILCSKSAALKPYEYLLSDQKD
ncbi:AI-2E family transporter [Aquimarina addita]|uniref:AI-2E family transporter n=1 Tax=Aquimarina addita TaxID=870485 RepID=A0ABP7X7V9_9FLAO